MKLDYPFRSRLSLAAGLTISLFLSGQRAILSRHPSPARFTETAAIVDQFYPQALIDEALADNDPVDRASCSTVYDVLPGGIPKTIVAGYSNGVSAAIRVIQAQPNGSYGIAFEPANLSLAGIDCAVELVDVDGDGIKEIKMSFPSVRGNTADWLFRWDGQRLLNIGPVTTDEDGTFSTDLMNVSFVDVRHDGTLQVFSIGEYPPPIDGSLPTEPNTLFKLVNGVYVPDKPLLLLAPFERQKGAPRPQSISFSASPGLERALCG